MHRPVRRYVAAAALATLILAALTGCDGSPVALTGTVSSASSGEVLAGVPVRVYASSSEQEVASSVTDANGAFTFWQSTLPPGSYRVLLSERSWWLDASSWASATTITVEPGRPATIEATIEPSTGSVTGRVTAGDDPVEGAAVEALSVTGRGVVATGETDDQGGYALEGVPTGAYKIRVSAPGVPATFHPASPSWEEATEVAIAEDQVTLDADVDTVVPASVSGQVVASGSPRSGLVVLALAGDPAHLAGRATTDGTGRFRIADLHPTDHQLVVIDQPSGAPVVVGADPGDVATAFDYSLRPGADVEIGRFDLDCADGGGPCGAPVRSASLELLTGTAATATATFAEAAAISDVVLEGAAPPGLTVSAASRDGAGDDRSTELAVAVGAELDAIAGAADLRVTAVGCARVHEQEPCPEEERIALSMEVAVTTSAPGLAIPDGFPAPDSRRWVPAEGATATLPDEVGIGAAAGATPEQVAALVSDVGGGLTGAYPELGYYQARVADVAVATAALELSPLVDGVDPVVGQQAALDLEPGDWDDDQVNDDATWTFRQIGALEAWDRTVGSASVDVGVVDFGIYDDHTDLRLHSFDPGQAYDRGQALGRNNIGHGTHVAGTLCLPDGNGGLVGAMHECRLHALDLAGHSDPYWAANPEWTDPYLQWPQQLREMASWLEAHPKVSVVNLSFTLVGSHRNLNGCGSTFNAVQHARIRAWFAARSDVLWVVAAGNCNAVPGANRLRLAQHHLPAALHTELPNVVAVSATGPTDSATGVASLADYSAPDGTVAAPGGTSDRPVWSSQYGACDSAGRCASTWSDRTRPARDGTTSPMSGTSMAAPLVAGAAGLMSSVNRGMDPASLKSCLVHGATTTVQGVSVRELWLPAALDCAERVCHGREATIVGTSAAEELRGTEGDDVIVGLGGDDAIIAGGGDDLVCPGAGSDYVEAGDGADQVDGTDTGFVGPGGGVDYVDGGPGDDVLTGSGGDSLLGRDGDDELTAADDTGHLEGGDGADSLRGGDYLDGGSGDDVLRGGPRARYLDGGDGDDQLFGGLGTSSPSSAEIRVYLEGGLGDDVLEARSVRTYLDGGDTAADPEANDGADTLRGGPGADVLEGGTGPDLLIGGRGRDVYLGGEGDDVIEGDDGRRDERFDCGGGEDAVRYDRAADRAVDRVECEVEVASPPA